MDNAHVSANKLEHDHLWDRAGDEWQTKWSQWASPSQASRFAKRDQGIVVSDGPGEDLRWLSGREAAAWWTHAKGHFEVPGKSSAEPDSSGRTWAAHIFKRGDDRLLVVETFC